MPIYSNASLRLRLPCPRFLFLLSAELTRGIFTGYFELVVGESGVSANETYLLLLGVSMGGATKLVLFSPGSDDLRSYSSGKAAMR